MFRQDCEQEIYGLARLCEKAVVEQMQIMQAQDKYIKEQGQFVQIQERELQRRAKVMKILEEENAAWYKNPYITILLGFAAGGLATQVAR